MLFKRKYFYKIKSVDGIKFLVKMVIVIKKIMFLAFFNCFTYFRHDLLMNKYKNSEYEEIVLHFDALHLFDQ